MKILDIVAFSLAGILLIFWIWIAITSLMTVDKKQPN